MILSLSFLILVILSSLFSNQSYYRFIKLFWPSQRISFWFYLFFCIIFLLSFKLISIMMFNIPFFSLLWVSFVHSLFKFLRWKWRSLVCNLFVKDYLFIYFGLCWVFVATHGLFSSCGKRGLFFFTAVCGLLLVMASPVAEHGLYMCSRHGDFSSHSTQAYLPCGMWDLSGSEIGSLFPALVDGFVTTGPPGKPSL